MGKNTVQPKLDKCYSDSAPLEIKVKRQCANSKHGHTDMNNAECSGGLKHQKLHKPILTDRKLKLCEIAEELKI